MNKKIILIITMLLIYTLICKTVYTVYNNHQNYEIVKTTNKTKINDGKKIQQEFCFLKHKRQKFNRKSKKMCYN